MDKCEIRAFEMLWHPMRNEYEHVTDKCQMPCVEPLKDISPDKMMAFDEFVRKKPSNCAVHCFKGDHLLERIWKRPEYYGRQFASVPFVTSPDFSVSPCMPLPVIGYNLFRAKRITQIWNSMGVRVVPTVIWANAETYDLCFEGLPTKSFLAVSSVGTVRDSLSRLMFVRGIREAIRRLVPVGLLFYGPLPRLDFTIEIPTWHFRRKICGCVSGYQQDLF